MRNILKKSLVVGTICSIIFAVPAFAKTENIYQNNSDRYKREATAIDTTRGDYISASNSGITNAGGGAIGISAATTAHEPVDKIRIHLYLDRLDTDNRWTQVDDFDFTFTPEDDPSGELTIAAVEFEVNNQPSGYYYRVRGTHGVWKNGVTETQSTWTDGVMITDTP